MTARWLFYLHRVGARHSAEKYRQQAEEGGEGVQGFLHRSIVGRFKW
jgi:hypothetical protein